MCSNESRLQDFLSQGNFQRLHIGVETRDWAMSLEGMKKDGVQLAFMNKRGYVGTEIVGMETMPLLYFFSSSS